MIIWITAQALSLNTNVLKFNRKISKKMSSAHVVRKQGIADTAFNHEIHDELNDDIDHGGDGESDDDEAPETKNQYFEFSNSYFIMRFIKLLFLIQVLSLLLDHTEIKIPILFDIYCRGLLTYSREFYSRPFLDLIYLIQYFWHSMEVLAQQQDVPTTPSNVEVDTPVDIRRQLNINP